MAETRRRGWQVRALTRRPGSLDPTLAQEVRGDLADPAGLQPLLAGMDAVVHLAAVTHTNRVAKYYQVNVQGTANLLTAAQEAGVGRFLLVSTRAAAPGCGAYGESKLAAEELARGSGLAWSIARPAEVYGVDQGEAIGRLIQAATERSLVLMPGRGRFTLALVWAGDVAWALAEILARPECVSRAYTLAGPEEFTYAGLVDRLAARRGRPVNKLGLPLAALRLAALLLSPWERPFLVRDQIPRLACPKSADISAARQDFGYNPRSLWDHLADSAPAGSGNISQVWV
ncbi:MAG: NAD(P)-dependent oxidoreductase [Deltaproteobacteria bacterium]|nr:NAD(P)-dependent oxidoreductase [Deltaproteobacteria bacterium]